MKIVVLDFDGVIRTYRSIMNGSGGPDKVDLECVANLNRIIKATGARVVVSSSWRGKYKAPMQRLLRSWGVRGQVVGVTPRLDTNHKLLILAPSRWTEIKEWLDARGLVESFVIFDDESIGWEGPEFIRTDFKVGLTASDAERAIEILRGR